VRGKDGALYGVTGAGGGNTACAAISFPPSCGVIFQLKPLNAAKTAWRETVLHRFTNRDGGIPLSSLTLDPASGRLYGTTWIGGIDDNGTVFRLIPPATAGRAWRFDTLYKFKNGSDGWGPNGSLAFRNGVLYGTAGSGGRFDGGVIFQLAPPAWGNGPWRLTTLYTGHPNQGSRLWGVTMAANGSLYVPAFLGGNNSCSSGCGAILKLMPPVRGSKKWSVASLHRFSGADGEAPSAPLTLIGHHVYGSTQQGGDYSTCDGRGCGVLFDLGP
jgi:hypothetical protein